jgi:ABC-2 type transport system ATP-binding protein
MSLLFSSHLLPDVEAVCDYVIVIGAGKLLTQGRIDELKQAHGRWFEVRLKADPTIFAKRLEALGCTIDLRDDLVRVKLPEREDQQMLWRVAAQEREQIRFLRPQRSTLEEVFLNAVDSR